MVSGKQVFVSEDTPDALIERIECIEKQLAEIGEKKGAINQELKTDKENRERLGALIEDADKKKAEYQKWSRLNQLIGDATGKKFRTIAQSYVLTSLIHSASFMERAVVLCCPWEPNFLMSIPLTSIFRSSL